MFLATGREELWGGRIFFKKNFRQFFVTKMKKTLVIIHKNYYIDYAFVNKKNLKLEPNLLLTLRAMFSKIWAP